MLAVLRSLNRWVGNEDGHSALIFCLVAVPLLLVVTGAAEMMDLSSQKTKLQAAVDAGALAGAAKLSLALYDADTQASSAAATTAAQNLGAADATFTVTVDHTANTLTLTGVAPHRSLTGLINLGNSVMAKATAEALQKTPLCILQTGGSGGIQLANASTIRASGCLVHANDNIVVASTAMITAERVQASGTVTGPTTPAGNSGALPIPDPFASMSLNPTSLCSLSLNIIATPLTGDTTIPPGVHCLPILAVGNTHVHLQPGEHYFVGGLVMSSSSVLDGDDVVLIFSPLQIFNFADKATIRLSARRSGPFAGFLIATTRDNTKTFEISSTNVSQLLGTIYIPNATLDVTTSGNVAQDSDWSIIVAKKLTLSNGPTLVINKNYAGSGVPVPDGVGPMSVTRLKQ